MAARHPPLSEHLPLLVFGCGTFNHQYHKDPFALGTTGLVQQALDLGVRAFDTSPYYGPSEELLGSALNSDHVRQNHARESYYILTKIGRIGAAEFDYSPEWVRTSIARSLQRLHTPYLDVVYCHDVEFVSPEEALAAIKELRRIRDEDRTIKYVGISGYPIDVLCTLAERVLAETGEPLDVVMSYALFTLQNNTLASKGVERLKAAGVSVVPNASPLGMGLLRGVGPPVGLIDFHPAGQELRDAIQKASDFCTAHGERIETIAMRFSFEHWLQAGASVGSRGPATLGNVGEQQASALLGGQRLGVCVAGLSNVEELEKMLQIWHSILDGRENGQALSAAAGRWKRAHEWSVNRRRAVEILGEGIQDILGEWLNYSWPSPPEGFVNQRRP